MIIVIIPLLLTHLLCQPAISTNRKFPADFKFGVASSAYQIEGGHDSRGETDFDHYQALYPSMVTDSSDAHIACDSYHRYHDDINLVANLGVDFYRFSISWARLLPGGHTNSLNLEGVRYYNDLIDGLLAKNIQPVVTMVHMDVPKPVHHLGGWLNPLVIDLFEDYSKVLFEHFGDRVKTWITFNANFFGCGDEEWPEKTNKSGVGEYWCLKNILLAHARVYHLYQREFKEQGGQIGFTLDGRWFEPASSDLGDVEAAQRVREFNLGMLTNPIYGEGDYPKIATERVAELSRNQGFLRSRLPPLTPQEVQYIKGSYDFLGLNVYTTFLVEDDRQYDSDYKPSYYKDLGANIYQNSSWKGSKSTWLKVTPWGLRNILKWFKEKYNNPPVLITENGFSDDGQLEDLDRIDYYKGYLGALLEAIHEDGVQVKGYAAWSLMDNFEWFSGYSEKFGLYHVDFSDPERKRTPKASAKWYKGVVATRELPVDGVSKERSEL